MQSRVLHILGPWPLSPRNHGSRLFFRPLDWLRTNVFASRVQTKGGENELRLRIGHEIEHPLLITFSVLKPHMDPG